MVVLDECLQGILRVYGLLAVCSKFDDGIDSNYGDVLTCEVCCWRYRKEFHGKQE